MKQEEASRRKRGKKENEDEENERTHDKEMKAPVGGRTERRTAQSPEQQQMNRLGSFTNTTHSSKE